MSFGQPSGPPATARQLRDLTALVESAGHTGFRDARGPLGLTQRQAGGRFTRDEAEDLIARLEAEAEGAGDTDRRPGRPDRPLRSRQCTTVARPGRRNPQPPRDGRAWRVSSSGCPRTSWSTSSADAAGR